MLVRVSCLVSPRNGEAPLNLKETIILFRTRAFQPNSSHMKSSVSRRENMDAKDLRNIRLYKRQQTKSGCEPLLTKCMWWLQCSCREKRIQTWVETVTPISKKLQEKKHLHVLPHVCLQSKWLIVYYFWCCKTQRNENIDSNQMLRSKAHITHLLA